MGSKPQLTSPPEQKKKRNPHPHLGSFRVVNSFPFVVDLHDVFEGPHFNDLWTFALGADEADLQDENRDVFLWNRNFWGRHLGVVYTGTEIFNII